MKDLRFFETSETACLVTQRHIPEERIPEISNSWESTIQYYIHKEIKGRGFMYSGMWRTVVPQRPESSTTTRKLTAE